MNTTALAVIDPEQAVRQTYIGSSDIAAILGLSNWATPLTTYLKKIGSPDVPPPSPETQRLWKRGKRREPEVLNDAIELYGLNVTKRSTPENPNRYTDPEFDWMRAEIDFEFEVTEDLAEQFGIPSELVGTIQNGEIKTIHPFAAKKFGDELTDEIPVEYAAQGAFGMMVRNKQMVLFLLGIDANDPVPYIYLRDDEQIAGMRQKAIDFWTKHVLVRVPPDPIDWPDMMLAFAKVNGRPVDLDEEAAAIWFAMREAGDKKKAWDAEYEEKKFQLADYIRRQWGLEKVDQNADNAIILLNGTEIATWKKQSATRIDADALRRAEPDIAAEYSKTSWTRVFRAKKAK